MLLETPSEKKTDMETLLQKEEESSENPFFVRKFYNVSNRGTMLLFFLKAFLSLDSLLANEQEFVLYIMFSTRITYVTMISTVMPANII